MTPERIEDVHAALKRHRKEGAVLSHTDLAAIDEALTLAKAAIPIGQVAEDVERVRAVMLAQADHTGPVTTASDALARLAAKAHGYEAAWSERAKAIAEKHSALADNAALPEFCAREAFRAVQRAEWGHSLPKGMTLEQYVPRVVSEAVARVPHPGAALLGRLKELEARCARLSVAGQALSAHADKTAGGPLDEKEAAHNALGMPEMTAEARAVLAVRRAVRAERALMRAGFEDHGGEDWAPPIGAPEPYKTTVGHTMTGPELLWTMRDEFAKAALTGLLASDTRDGELRHYAADAYAAADAMVAERERKP